MGSRQIDCRVRMRVAVRSNGVDRATFLTGSGIRRSYENFYGDTRKRKAGQCHLCQVGTRKIKRQYNICTNLIVTRSTGSD
jgi:uncharacterized protein (UPF0305 family)